MTASDASSPDVFITYAEPDRGWAEWIAWQLSESGVSVVLGAWDFRPGNVEALERHRATQADRTLLIVSPDALASDDLQADWAAALGRDPTGADRRLIPVRVRACRLTGLLTDRVAIDLVDLDADTAKARLLESLKQNGRPQTAPPYPGPDLAEAPPFPPNLPTPSPRAPRRWGWALIGGLGLGVGTAIYFGLETGGTDSTPGFDAVVRVSDAGDHVPDAVFDAFDAGEADAGHEDAGGRADAMPPPRPPPVPRPKPLAPDASVPVPPMWTVTQVERAERWIALELKGNVPLETDATLQLSVKHITDGRTFNRPLQCYVEEDGRCTLVNAHGLPPVRVGDRFVRAP